MNERIRELYLQAHSIRYYDNDPSLTGNPPTVYWQGEVSAQRFAELIVRECVECLKPLSRNHSMVGAAQDTIREHFGVEE